MQSKSDIPLPFPFPADISLPPNTAVNRGFTVLSCKSLQGLAATYGQLQQDVVSRFDCHMLEFWLTNHVIVITRPILNRSPQKFIVWSTRIQLSLIHQNETAKFVIYTLYDKNITGKVVYGCVKSNFHDLSELSW